MASISAAWSRVTGRGATVNKTLPTDLKRVTNSGVIDIPKELLTPVIAASNNEEDRPEIMKHVRECLAEPSGKQWRRIYGALVLVDALLKEGSPALIAETAAGRHFDLVQRLSFLEHFDNTDKRVMNNIRKKAEEIRKDVIPLIESASLKDTEDCKDTASTCSPGAISTITQNTAASSSNYSSGDTCSSTDPLVEDTEPRKRTMILNNIVAVGHSDDTTSESEGNNDGALAAVQYREPRRMTAKARYEQSCRLNGGNSNDESRNPADRNTDVKAAADNGVDLLGL